MLIVTAIWDAMAYYKNNNLHYSTEYYIYSSIS